MKQAEEWKKCVLYRNGRFGIKVYKLFIYLRAGYRRNTFLPMLLFSHNVLSWSWDFFFFLSVSPGENKSIPNFLLLVSLLQWNPLEIRTVLQEARRLYIWSPPLCPPFLPPDLAVVLHTLPPSSTHDGDPAQCPGKPVYTTEKSTEQGDPPARAGSSQTLQSLSSRDFALGLVWNVQLTMSMSR
jgi:hypothetical protein